MLYIIIGIIIPLIFLYQFIINLIDVIKCKRNKEPMDKSALLKVKIFGILVLVVIVFYVSFLVYLSLAIRYM